MADEKLVSCQVLCTCEECSFRWKVLMGGGRESPLPPSRRGVPAFCRAVGHIGREGGIKPNPFLEELPSGLEEIS